jgi:predicted N-formylglutamate amidohydrolase
VTQRGRARDVLLVTCEHGGNRVPRGYLPLFRGRQRALHSHRGYDPGSLAMARALARAFHAPLVASTITRLLVELNRSPWNPRVFSQATRGLPVGERERIVARYYTPYRIEVEARVARAVEAGSRVIHVSSHSFTPVLDGKRRDADIGILYDPARAGEAALARAWVAALAQRAPSLRVRRNYPYAGKSDGLTTYLRRRFAARDYVGLELEMSQALVARPAAAWRALRASVILTLRDALGARA